MAELAVDHLVWCAATLQEGMDAFEELSGVKPCVGGQHQGLGTHNALVSLGEGVYLEILAKDPAQEVEPKWIGIDCPRKPCLASWCARAPPGPGNLEAMAARAAEAGYDPGPATSFSRQNTKGETLKWRLACEGFRAGHAALPFGGVVPFVVDWSVNPLAHPAEIAPSGCRLLQLRAWHPDVEAASRALSALGASLALEPGEPRLEAVLETPKGTIRL